MNAIPTQVVCAIIQRDNLILACRRSLKKSQGGLWEFPGGKLHTGESPEAGLEREIFEELGISIKVGEFIARSVFTYNHGTIELSAYACLMESGEIALAEHEEFRWVGVQEFKNLDWAPADIAIVNALLADPFRKE